MQQRFLFLPVLVLAAAFSLCAAEPKPDEPAQPDFLKAMPPSPPLKPGDVTNSTTLKTACRFDMAEFVVEVKPDMLAGRNPYAPYMMEVSIRKPLALGEVPPLIPKALATCEGFYAGENRFVARWLAHLPPGTYAYQLGFMSIVSPPPPAATGNPSSRINLPESLTFAGEFTIAGESTALCKGPLQVSANNPIWFADRDGKPVFFCGAWAHSSLDISQLLGHQYGAWGETKPETFNKYIDLPTASGHLEKDGRATAKYFAEIDKLVADLAAHRTTMVCVTADHMGWGFQSASNWKGKRAGEFTDPFSYDPNAGKIWDYFLEAARQKGIYVKINLMEFCQGRYAQHPFRAIPGVDLQRKSEKIDDVINNKIARIAWSSWVRYLTSRYGAFSNVHFQMGNEPPGDWYERPEDEWKAMDKETMDSIKRTAGYPVLYSSGAPVGTNQLLQADYDVEHANPRGLGGASCYIYKRPRKLPFHIEEIEAYNGQNKDLWLANCRYEKFACFAQGFYASALVMWSWKKSDDTLDRYHASTLSIMAFVDPVLNDLFDFAPDNTIIAGAPAEVALSLVSKKHAMVYMQKDDPNIKPAADAKPLPATLLLKLPDGSVTVNWFDPSTGKYLAPIPAEIKNGALELTPPAIYTDDIALRISRK